MLEFTVEPFEDDAYRIRGDEIDARKTSSVGLGRLGDGRARARDESSDSACNADAMTNHIIGDWDRVR